ITPPKQSTPAAAPGTRPTYCRSTVTAARRERSRKVTVRCTYCYAWRFRSRLAEADFALIGSGRVPGGSGADGLAVDNQLDAAVALAALGRVVGSDGLRLTKALCGDRRSRHAFFGEEVTDGIGTALRKLLVELVGADAIRMPLDLQRQARMGEQNAGDLGQLFARPGLQPVAAGVEEHIGHVHDEAAGGIACLYDGVELSEELRGKLGLVGFVLLGGLAGSLGIGLRPLGVGFSFLLELEGGVLLGNGGGTGFVSLFLLPGGLCSGLLRFCLHA